MNAQLDFGLRGLLLRPTWGAGPESRFPAFTPLRRRIAVAPGGHLSQQLWLLNLEDERTWAIPKSRAA